MQRKLTNNNDDILPCPLWLSFLYDMRTVKNIWKSFQSNGWTILHHIREVVYCTLSLVPDIIPVITEYPGQADLPQLGQLGWSKGGWALVPEPEEHRLMTPRNTKHIRLSLAQNFLPWWGSAPQVRGVVKFHICVGRIFKGRGGLLLCWNIHSRK